MLFVIAKDYETLPECFYSDFMVTEKAGETFPPNFRVFKDKLSILDVAALVTGLLTRREDSKILFIDGSDTLYT